MISYRHGSALAALSVVAALVAGCVTSGREYSKDGFAMLAARHQQAVPPAELNPVPMILGQPLDVEILGEDPVVQIDGQEVFGKLYALPAWSGPYTLRIASFREGSPGDPAILYPLVIFYDANFHETRRSEPGLFQYRLAGSAGADGLHGTIFVNDDRGERYLLIGSTRPDPLTLKTVNLSVVQNATLVSSTGAVWMVPTGGKDYDSQMVASPRGKLRLALELYRPQKLDGTGTQTSN